MTLSIVQSPSDLRSTVIWYFVRIVAPKEFWESTQDVTVNLSPPRSWMMVSSSVILANLAVDGALSCFSMA